MAHLPGAGAGSRASIDTRIVACALLISTVALAVPRASLAATPGSAAFIDSGTVTLVTGGSVADLDPASVVSAAANIVITRNIAETLIAYNGSDVNHFVPLLATSWSSSPDKSVWTLHLRHGVRFHTGRCCMTADDVKYSIARTVLAGLAGAYIFGRFMTDPMKQIQVVDPYTVRFNLGRPQYTFINAIASKNVAMIVDARALRAHATKSDPWAHNWITDHDAGTGPYVLAQWQHGVQEVLTRFAPYWRGWSGAHFSRAIVREIPEASTRRELVEKGQADITFGLTPQDATAMSSNPAVRVVAPYGTEIDYIAMTEAGPLASPYARQAMSYAFAYDAFLTAAYKGYAKRGYGPLASTLHGYDPHVFKYTTDMAKARALFAKAGIKPGTTLTYLYAAGYPVEKTAGLILQAQLGQLGITLTPRGVDQATQGTVLFGNTPPARRPNLMFYAWWPDYNDAWDECVTLLASSSAGSAGANIGFYHNKQVDALLDKIKYDAPEQLAVDAAKMQDIVARTDPAAIWLAEPAQATELTRSLRGFVFNPLDLQTYEFYPMYRA